MRYTRQYRIESRTADARLVGFVNLMFLAFRPEIEALQVEKARAIQRYRATHGGDPFEDRAVEILSHVEIDVPAHRGGATPHEEARR